MDNSVLAAKRGFSAVVLALLFGVAGVANAGNTTGSLTVSGTITDAPPPVTCTMSGSNSLFVGYALPAEGAASYSKSSPVTVTCTAGATVALTVAQDLIPIKIGSGNASVRVSVGGVNIGVTPYVYTATGADAIQFVSEVYGENGGRLVAGTHVGLVSGNVMLTAAY